MGGAAGALPSSSLQEDDSHSASATALQDVIHASGASLPGEAKKSRARTGAVKLEKQSSKLSKHLQQQESDKLSGKDEPRGLSMAVE
jgi:hypothetical protein